MDRLGDAPYSDAEDMSPDRLYVPVAAPSLVSSAPRLAQDHESAENGIDAPPSIGGDERRMQVRAYNYWLSLLGERTYPAIDDLDPATLPDFGPNSVLLDFTAGVDHPAITYLGAALREECGIDAQLETIADVPPRSLLSRLTDHYLQILGNCAPVGFEAEFLNLRGNTTFYRGILMPFSSDDESIDFVYGVINWKEVASLALNDALAAELDAVLTPEERRHLGVDEGSDLAADLPVSGQSAPHPAAPDPEPPTHNPLTNQLTPYEEDAAEGEPDARDRTEDADLDTQVASLADGLAIAREGARLLTHVDARGRSALYRALALAYDFALLARERPDEYAELLADTGLKGQARAPMTPIVKLVFGATYDKTRITEFAAALSFGQRHGLPRGAMRLFLERYPGGLKAVVKAERRQRRPADRPTPREALRGQARALDVQAMLSLEGDDEFVMLIARRVDDGRVGIVGVVPDDPAMLDRALRQVMVAETGSGKI